MRRVGVRRGEGRRHWRAQQTGYRRVVVTSFRTPDRVVGIDQIGALVIEQGDLWEQCAYVHMPVPVKRPRHNR